MTAAHHPFIDEKPRGRARPKAEKRQAPAPMRNLSPNDLRRTFASLEQAGVDSMAASRMVEPTQRR